MIAVYIASPYTVGELLANVRRQIDTAEQLATAGYVPDWPLCSHYWNEIHPHEHEFWMRLDFEKIARCDVLLRLPGESAGADREERFAKGIGLPVFYSLESLFENLPPDGWCEHAAEVAG